MKRLWFVGWIESQSVLDIQPKQTLQTHQLKNYEISTLNLEFATAVYVILVKHKDPFQSTSYKMSASLLCKVCGFKIH